MAKQVSIMAKLKITIYQLEKLLVDEQKASREYKKLSKKSLTKWEKERFLAMSKDEARHAEYIEIMIFRRKML